MQYPRYELLGSKELDAFEFTSVGPKGNIEKMILFDETDSFFYNVAFGNKIEVVIDGQVIPDIDDSVISDNGDRDMILATVVGAIYEYTNRFPERWLFFKGFDDVRTRLYRMAITNNYAELCKDFSIFGFNIVNGKKVMVSFNGNTNFYGFVVKRNE